MSNIPQSADEARAMLHTLSIAIQKCRSTCMESFDNMSDGDLVDPEEFYETLFPWLFGDRCMLTAVVKLSESQVLTPMDLYNILHLCHRPEMSALIGVWYAISSEEYVPEAGPWCYTSEWPS